jgi:hypothetical protein
LLSGCFWLLSVAVGCFWLFFMILYGICCGILGSSFAVANVLLRILFAVASDVESAVESVVGYVVR